MQWPWHAKCNAGCVWHNNTMWGGGDWHGAKVIREIVRKTKIQQAKLKGKSFRSCLESKSWPVPETYTATWRAVRSDGLWRAAGVISFQPSRRFAHCRTSQNVIGQMKFRATILNEPQFFASVYRVYAVSTDNISMWIYVTDKGNCLLLTIHSRYWKGTRVKSGESYLQKHSG